MAAAGEGELHAHTLAAVGGGRGQVTTVHWTEQETSSVVRARIKRALGLVHTARIVVRENDEQKAVSCLTGRPRPRPRPRPAAEEDGDGDGDGDGEGKGGGGGEGGTGGRRRRRKRGQKGGEAGAEAGAEETGEGGDGLPTYAEGGPEFLVEILPRDEEAEAAIARDDPTDLSFFENYLNVYRVDSMIASERTYLGWVRTSLSVLSVASYFMYLNNWSNSAWVVRLVVLIAGSMYAVACLGFFAVGWDRHKRVLQLIRSRAPPVDLNDPEALANPVGFRRRHLFLPEQDVMIANLFVFTAALFFVSGIVYVANMSSTTHFVI